MNSKKILPFFLVLPILGLFAYLVIGFDAVGVFPTPSPTATTAPSSTATLVPVTPSPVMGFATLTPIATARSYPAASAVRANAVVFIAVDENYNYSLWIANVDGGGERKLTDIEKNAEWVSRYLLKWSPDGDWIGYISGDDLWIISPADSVQRRILSIQDTDKKIIRQYTWSPDSSKIAYALAANWGDFTEIKTGLFDLSSETDSELFSYQSPATITLSWSPNGRYLLFNKDVSFFVYEVGIRKIVKEIKSTEACWTTWHDGLRWSPNGDWLYHTHHGNGRYATNWICISGLDGSNRNIYVEGTTSTPVWDKTGDFLYFVARRTNPDSDPNLKIDERLMRYDIRAQKTEHLLSLREHQTYDYIQSISISPDRRTLLLESQFSKSRFDLIFVDIQSLAATNFTVDFESLKIPLFYAYFLETAWSPDSRNLILLAGDVCTPYQRCIQYTGAF